MSPAPPIVAGLVNRPGNGPHVPPVLSIVAGPVIDRGPLPRCPRVARIVDRPRASWSSTGQRSPRAARAVDRRRAGHRLSNGSYVPPVPPIVAGLVIDRATVPTCRPCCRSSPGWSSTGQRSPHAARAVDRRRAGHRPGNGPHVSPAVPIVAGLVIDRATCRGPSPRPCRPWRRSSPAPVIDRETVAALPACRPCCRSSPAWSSTGDPCHAAHVSPVLSIVAGLVIDRPSRGEIPAASFSRIAAGRSRE